MKGYKKGEDDSVYMENSSYREEYVMNDSGRIWVGSQWRNYGRPWNFGQVNSLDDDGMLEGRWTADYPEDSTKPTAWTGSVSIIKQYMETKEPVKYGQCWVFSGLTTTCVMRCGPAPLRAVKDGHVYLNYDVGFVFSEVNGDRIVWEVNEDKGTMEVMQIDRHSVGWNISTKAVDKKKIVLPFSF
ncbi:TGM1 [Mytilus coruscus]|uniref:TGM1 n=1 Tax=Mytilus coruscus TaxID=42192 RepID=A0A6J8AXL3_MYTCO|nr:TGM1 [Mytilus coruscus]